jgi:hypothetical protein
MFNDSWGEQMSTRVKPVIAIFNLLTDEFEIVDSFLDGFAPANVVWYKNEGLVFAAYQTKPYKLGYIYCPIRK